MLSQQATATTTSFLLRQAESAHDMGLCPIPMQAGTKKPAITFSHFIHSGNRPTLETLRDWWGRYPEANLGVLLGANSGGTMVLDFDDRNDYRSWAETKPELAAWLPTVQTRDGFHVYVRSAEGFTASHDLRPHGLNGELKGDGTLTVFPGSVVDEHTYSWVIAPEPTGIPPVCLATSGLVPEQFLSTIHNFTQNTKRKRSKAKKSKNTVNNGKSNSTQSDTVLRSPTQSHAVVPPKTKQLQFSISDFEITGKSQRNSALLRLSAALGNHAGPDGVNPEDAMEYHDQWFDQYGEICTTDREASELEFLDMVERYRGDTFLWRLAKGFSQADLPYWAKVTFKPERMTKARELCRLLAYADELSTGGSFYLTLRKMAEMVGYATHDAANNAIYRLERRGIIEVAERGNRTKANVYRLLVDCDGRVREQQEA